MCSALKAATSVAFSVRIKDCITVPETLVSVPEMLISSVQMKRVSCIALS